MTLTLDIIQSWSPKEMRARLSASPESAAEILRVGAEGGVADAQALYGQILLDGQGVAIDQRAALHWFSKAAQGGHIMAMNMVGRCCEQGWGTHIDPARAAEWYKAAADKGLDWAMYNLATLYALGQGVAQDHNQALRLYRAAAARGHIKSLSMIGGFYEDGWVVAPDMAAAAEYYRKGAEGGDFRAMFNHARMLIAKGEVDAALHWLHQLPATATPAFLDKTRQWLRAQDIAALQDYAAEI